MAYQVGMIGRIFFVRWHDKPSSVELAALLREVEQSRKLAGIHLLYLTVVPRDLPEPDHDERAALEDYARQARPYVERGHIVLEGGLTGAAGSAGGIQRGIVVAHAYWKDEHGQTALFGSVEDALAAMCAEFHLDNAAVLKDASEQGLLAGAPGASGASGA